MIGDPKPSPELEELNDLQVMQLEAPAVFSNYFFVWSDGGIIRMTFAERGAGDVLIPRSAVCMTMDNAKAVHDLLGRTIEAVGNAEQKFFAVKPMNDRPL